MSMTVKLSGTTIPGKMIAENSITINYEKNKRASLS